MADFLMRAWSAARGRPSPKALSRSAGIGFGLTLMCVAALTSFSASAHDDKPQYGGVLTVENDRAYELVVKEGQLVLYVNDHDTPVSLAGANGYLVIGNSSQKSERYTLKQVEVNGMAAVGAEWPVGEKATAALKMRSGRQVVVAFVRN